MAYDARCLLGLYSRDAMQVNASCGLIDPEKTSSFKRYDPGYREK